MNLIKRLNELKYLLDIGLATTKPMNKLKLKYFKGNGIKRKIEVASTFNGTPFTSISTYNITCELNKNIRYLSMSTFK